MIYPDFPSLWFLVFSVNLLFNLQQVLLDYILSCSSNLSSPSWTWFYVDFHVKSKLVSQNLKKKQFCSLMCSLCGTISL